MLIREGRLGLAFLLVGVCTTGLFADDGVGVKKVTPVPRDVQPSQIPGSRPQNVVFILSDDHRYDAMSFLGHQFAETPHLDSLAANGVHFKNAFVTTSLCSPSRASILTGLYTFRHRVIDNNRLVPEGTIFFPQYLQKAGYAT
ncbi:MAG: acetylglucosamine-6-sulfatase, partial [Planctomycetia bacterium]|nr:acetylglucosamine-6-sulfatase [Planctomycetia bacterium]